MEVGTRFQNATETENDALLAALNNSEAQSLVHRVATEPFGELKNNQGENEALAQKERELGEMKKMQEEEHQQMIWLVVWNHIIIHRLSIY